MRSRIPLALVTLIVLAASGCGRLEPLSTSQALDRLNVATSKVYDAAGNVIADLHGEINRDTATLKEIPRSMRDAAVAIEDERFWQHQGVDLRSIVRALLRNTQKSGSGVQGASTITQQLAKNLYFSGTAEKSQAPARTLSRKVAELRVTLELERQYSKSKILEMYLNTIYLGRGMYGVETAAHSYFNKSASQLTLPESAFLAGLIHEPSRYEWTPSDPASVRAQRTADARIRRNYVLDRMAKLKMITASQATSAKATPLDVEPLTEQQWQHPYFVNLVLRQLGVIGNGQLDPRFNFLGDNKEERAGNIYKRGLRVFTTLDPKAQSAAEKAVADVMPKDLKRLSVALAAVEPRTGYIRAIIGGRDYYPTCETKAQEATQECRLARVNLALGRLGGGSGRQPGSSFKPFVLAAALERGISLYQAYSGGEFTYSYPGGVWNVHNYEGGEGGAHTLVDATAHSINAVFAHLEIDGVGDGDGIAGAGRVADIARRMGVGLPTPQALKARCGSDYLKTPLCTPADITPSIALGAREVSPLDMATAYATFANDGVREETTAIVRIEDAGGRTLYEAPGADVQAIPSGVARGVTAALEHVVTEGTGTAAAIGRPAAGKTGTSSGWRDAWFDGYTPQLAASIWVGNPENALESMTPANGYPIRVVGGTYPARIWHEFMAATMKGLKTVDFPDPPTALFEGSSTVLEPSPSPSGSPLPSDAVVGVVPNVIGSTFGEASGTIRAAGFRAATNRGCAASGNYQLHEVYEQSPAGGAQAPTGSTVSITYQGGNCD